MLLKIITGLIAPITGMKRRIKMPVGGRNIIIPRYNLKGGEVGDYRAVMKFAGDDLEESAIEKTCSDKVDPLKFDPDHYVLDAVTMMNGEKYMDIRYKAMEKDVSERDGAIVERIRKLERSMGGDSLIEKMSSGEEWEENPLVDGSLASYLADRLFSLSYMVHKVMVFAYGRYVVVRHRKKGKRCTR